MSYSYAERYARIIYEVRVRMVWPDLNNPDKVDLKIIRCDRESTDFNIIDDWYFNQHYTEVETVEEAVYNHYYDNASYYFEHKGGKDHGQLIFTTTLEVEAMVQHDGTVLVGTN